MVEIKENAFYKKVEIKTDVALTTGMTTNYIYALILSSFNVRTIVRRSYLKIQELFARVGGIANALLIMMNFLTYHFLRFDFLIFIDKSTFSSQQSLI